MNANCNKRFSEELEVLKELPNRRCGDCSIKQANKEYLKILELAAKEDESLVNEVLRLPINLEEEIGFEKVKRFIDSKQKPPEPTAVYIEPVDINGYDMLLETPQCVCV